MPESKPIGPEKLSLTARLIARMRKFGFDDAESQRLFKEWSEQKELESKDACDHITNNVERAIVYFASGYFEGAMQDLEDAAIQLFEEHHDELSNDLRDIADNIRLVSEAFEAADETGRKEIYKSRIEKGIAILREVITDIRKVYAKK